MKCRDFQMPTALFIMMLCATLGLFCTKFGAKLPIFSVVLTPLETSCLRLSVYIDQSKE